ncbi:MAG: hypothetical protein DI585_03195 [Pseudomonas fluorescens]|nr:MAG: hypothetical protein DI585_03195 [Pseudomonas fluorescens]
MSDKTYQRGGRILTAVDGYTTPIRFGSYLLDTYYKPGSAMHNWLALGRDTISNRESYFGGTVEKGETLLQALFGESAEEVGLDYNPSIAHKKVIAILSVDTEDRLDRRNDRTVVFNAKERVYYALKYNMKGDPGEYVVDPNELYNVGDCFKLRSVFRTKSTRQPVQQPPRHDELLPEVVNPRYELINSFEACFSLMRPSFQYAIAMAEKLDILYSLKGRQEVEPDWDDLADQWENLNIHPLIIEIFCYRQSSFAETLKQLDEINAKLDLTDAEANAMFSGMMRNLELAEKGLHNLLKHKLPHDTEIREILSIIKR